MKWHYPVEYNATIDTIPNSPSSPRCTISTPKNGSVFIATFNLRIGHPEGIRRQETQQLCTRGIAFENLSGSRASWKTLRHAARRVTLAIRGRLVRWPSVLGSSRWLPGQKNTSRLIFLCAATMPWWHKKKIQVDSQGESDFKKALRKR